MTLPELFCPRIVQAPPRPHPETPHHRPATRGAR